MRMTLEHFFTLLPREGWILDEEGRIRSTDERREHCPQTQAHRIYQAANGGQSAIWEDLMIDIWRAADKSNGYNPELRKRLLAHCGLPENA